MKLTSRDRVIKAINHEEADRIPIDLGGTIETGIHRIAQKNLMEYLGYPYAEDQLDIIQQLARPDQRILDRFRGDCYCILPEPPRTWTLEITSDEDATYFTDEWGVVFKKPHRGFYFDVHKSPLAEAGMADLGSFSWPDGKDPGRISGLGEKAQKVFNDTEYALIMGDGTWGLLAETAVLLGFERFYDCFIDNPKLIRTIVEKVLEFELGYMESILPEVKDYIQIVAIADDLGTQSGPMINPKIYREWVKPLHKCLIEHIKKLSGSRVFFHSCGAVSDFIPDFIEIGVDILNPVQVSAKGMDSNDLKKEFGADITFWGGGCDTQQVLPRGTPDQVKNEVIRRISDFSPGGGYVFCPVHNIQPDVPPENLLTMYETVLKHGSYV
jgi:uroporphyrinogen decarboxylase